MMDFKPDTSGFAKGQQIIYCPSCGWQTKEPSGIKPICPACYGYMRLWRVD